eukprot:15446096-Alexandrium_andersonii.AAC.1
MRNCLGRSKLELSGPRNGLSIDLRSFGGVNSMPLFAQTPNLATKRAGRRAGGGLFGGVRGGGVEPPPGR